MQLAVSSDQLTEEMLNLSKQILKSDSVDVNIQDMDGNTALHLAIKSKNKNLFKEILFNSNSKPNLNIKNKLDQTVLWLALVQSEDIGKLIKWVD